MNKKIEKSDIIILGIYFLAYFIIQSISYYEEGILLRQFIYSFPIEVISNTSIIFLFIFWLIPKFITSEKYILFTFLALLTLLFFRATSYTISFWLCNKNWDEFPEGLKFVHKMIGQSAQNSAFPFALLLTKKFYEGQTQYLKIEKQQKENELKLLRSQIDPHFLFNNLNTLDSLIDINTNKAKDYINRLSLIYRYLIQTKDSEVMELSKEIDFAKNYFFLIETRFEDDYIFSIEEKASVFNKFIPTGAIQTLIENVVKHNKKQHSPIKTVIDIEKEYLSITNIKSNIASKNESFGTGLNNLKIRYKHLSDKEMIIINTENEFKISIPIINLSE